MAKKTVKDIELKNKKVLIRVDFNVPLKVDGDVISVADDTRIVAALPTIKYVIENGGKPVVFSHLGRVKDESDKKKNTLRPVAKYLEDSLSDFSINGKKIKVVFIPETKGINLENAIKNQLENEIVVFENTRFEDLDGNKESKNNPELGKYWASLGDVFVNDAFGTAHRAHASNVGIASNIGAGNAVAGFLLEKEINFIGGTLENPKRPFVAILGGAKVSDKIEVIKNLLNVADKVLIGGGMAFTFLKAQGIEIGKSLVEIDKLDLAKELLELGKGKIVLGNDCRVSKTFSDEVAVVKNFNEIATDEMGLDIGPKTTEIFEKEIALAKTIIWNGPLGVFEFSNYEKGTKDIAVAIANTTKNGTISIIGGGDSAAAVSKFGLEDRYTHISTGGGASLEYLEGKKLPGIECVNDK